MGETKIEWTATVGPNGTVYPGYTFNPWRGCTKVSAGCDNCYADKMSGRNPRVLGVWGKYGTRVVASDAMWKEPLKWNRKAEAEGVRKRVFCASLADVFEGPETMPVDSTGPINEARVRLIKTILKTPNLDWLLLTKRPENFKSILLNAFAGEWADPMDVTDRVHAWIDGTNIPRNVWIGTSVEDQKTADERIPELLKIPAKVRFLSMEPLLGPVDLTSVIHLDGDGPSRGTLYWMGEGAGIDWVIVGGESGTKKRPFNADWARSIRDQCKSAGVAFFMKQTNKIDPIPPDLMIREFPISK